jgi:hypothetical protein
MKVLLRVAVVLFTVVLALPPGTSAGTNPSPDYVPCDVVVTYLELVVEPSEGDSVPASPSYHIQIVVIARDIPEADAEKLSIQAAETGFAYESRTFRRRIPAHRVQFVEVVRHR